MNRHPRLIDDPPRPVCCYAGELEKPAQHYSIQLTGIMNATLNPTLLGVFIPTFFLVSLTPGMCMTLSLTLGMTIGVRRTF